MKLLARLKAAFRWPGFGGSIANPGQTRRRSGIINWFLPGTTIDWVVKAGDLWKNSVVSLCLNWIILSWPESKPCVKQETENGIDTVVPGHPAALLLRMPNKYVSAHSFWSGLIISYWCDGNAYIRKIRNRIGEVTQLVYIPHYAMWPRWNEDGTDFISWYDYYVDGVTYKVAKEDIIHVRYGLDPDNFRKGLSPLKAQLRQVSQDNQASTYGAVLLENFGVPGLIISAEGGDTDPGAYLDPDSDESRHFERLLSARTTGDERGKPIFSPVAIKIDKLGYSPEEMALKELITMPALRICSAFNINALVLGLPNENQGTYDNFEQAERAAWNNCVIPAMAVIAEELTNQLLIAEPQFNYQPGQYIHFDLRSVRALQVNLKDLMPVIVQAAGGPVITPNEGREILQYPVLDQQDDLNKVRVPQNAGADANKPAGDKKDGD